MSLYDEILCDNGGKCPNCKSHLTIALLFPIYYKGKDCSHYCKSCGYRW